MTEFTKEERKLIERAEQSMSPKCIYCGGGGNDRGDPYSLGSKPCTWCKGTGTMPSATATNAIEAEQEEVSIERLAYLRSLGLLRDG